jgi:hypothetical protein
MSSFLTNKRPSSSTDWGVGNNNFAGRFIEPSALKKQVGWNDGEAPPAVIFNWIMNNYHRWIKNLDERTPKVPVHTWTVSNAENRPTDRDFSSLAECLSSPSVNNGDSILVASQEVLIEPLIISKSVRLVFTNDSYMYGESLDPSIRIILDAEQIGIVGGKFYSFGGPTFELTSNAESCSIEGCYFNSSTPIDDSAVPGGKLPSIRGLRYYVF